MMHKGMLWMSALVLAATLAIAAPIRAQENSTQGYTFSVGILRPTKSSVRAKTEDIWLSANLGYTFRTSEPTDTGYYYQLGVSVGYYGSNSKKNIYNIPVLFTYTGHLNEQFFYRAGAGIGFAKQYRNLEQPSKGTKNTTGFAYSIELGYNFNTGTTPVALTVGFAGVSGTDDQHTGLTAMLSFRF
ncbi:MAG: hypothetical protein C4337_08795 [Armatimonadota bacterium]